MAFHTVGDSHADLGWREIPGVIIHAVAGNTCYAFGRDGLSRLDIKSHGVQDGDTVCFCFGEIDCRGHVHKHSVGGKTYRDVIDEIVENYFKSIKLNVERYSDLKVCVYNVVPASRFLPNRHYPFIGGDQERRTYVKYFNSLLSTFCRENGYVFIDVHDDYTDDLGLLNQSLSDGLMHIKDSSHLKNFLKKNFLI